MTRSLPDDVLLCIAAHLSEDELQALIAVHPTFCHLAMRGRYETVSLADGDPDNLGRPYLMDYLTRLRYRHYSSSRFSQFTISCIPHRDPFVSGYVRSVEVRLAWKQKRWKKRGGMVTHQPTPDEERAIAETLAGLYAMDRLSLEWKSQPDTGAPAAFFSALPAALASRLRTLALHAPMFELHAFVEAVDTALLCNIERLDVLVVSSLEAHADEPTALGKWIAAAGTARLQSLKLILSPRAYLYGADPLVPCFVAMSSNPFGRLNTLEFAFLFREGSQEGIDELLTLFRHVSPTLQVLSLNCLCYTGESLVQRQRWVERWTAPLAALRGLKLEWGPPMFGSMFNSGLLEYLPQIRSTSVCLSDLTTTWLMLTPDSVERLLAGIPSSCPTLVRLQLTVNQLVPKTITLLALSCPRLVDLNIEFHRILGAENTEAGEGPPSWVCSHVFWKHDLEVR